MPDEIGRLSDAMARDPGGMSWVSLADALRRAGKLSAAERTAIRGLVRHPYHADGHDVLARISADARQLGRARDEWEMALELDARHVGAHLGMGWLALAAGDRDAATRWWNDARMLAPDDPRVVAAGQRVVAPAPVPVERRPMVDGSGDLFAPLAQGGALFALLVDDDGLVLAGSVRGRDGADRSDEVGAELSGLSRDAEGALRQLNLGEWERLLVECERGTIALAPAAADTVTLVATPAGTPAGLPRLLLDRGRRRAQAWLEAL